MVLKLYISELQLAKESFSHIELTEGHVKEQYARVQVFCMKNSASCESPSPESDFFFFFFAI